MHWTRTYKRQLETRHCYGNWPLTSYGAMPIPPIILDARNELYVVVTAAQTLTANIIQIATMYTGRLPYIFANGFAMKRLNPMVRICQAELSLVSLIGLWVKVVLTSHAVACDNVLMLMFSSLEIGTNPGESMGP